MPSELVAVLAALAGVILGGLINFLASRNVKDREWRLALAKEQIASRQKLYSEFLIECQRLVVEAMEEKVASPRELNTMNSKFAQITLIANEEVVECAKKVADYALSSHSQAGVGASKDFFSIKQRFINAARKEIASFSEI